MSFFHLILLFFTGFFVKLADEFCDQPKQEDYRGVFFGIVYGLLLGYVMTINSVFATVGLGIILGAIITSKFDSITHSIALVTVILTILSINIFQPIILVSLIYLTLCFLDEKTNDYFDLNKNRKKISKLFELTAKFRLFSHAGAIIIAVVLQEPLYWFSLLAFDLGYMLVTKISERLKG